MDNWKEKLHRWQPSMNTACNWAAKPFITWKHLLQSLWQFTRSSWRMGWMTWYSNSDAQSHTQSVVLRYQWHCKCLVSAWLCVDLVLSQIFYFCYLIKQCLFSFRIQMDCWTATNPSLDPYKMHQPFRRTTHCLGRCVRSELPCSICKLALREHGCCVLAFCLLIRWAKLKEKDVFSMFC